MSARTFGHSGYGGILHPCESCTIYQLLCDHTFPFPAPIGMERKTALTPKVYEYHGWVLANSDNEASVPTTAVPSAVLLISRSAMLCQPSAPAESGCLLLWDVKREIFKHDMKLLHAGSDRCSICTSKALPQSL